MKKSSPSGKIRITKAESLQDLLWIDIAIKAVGAVIAMTVYPPAMMYSVIIAAAFLMLSIRKIKLDWSDV